MRFGLFTCPYQRTSLERAFADAKNFGYHYIELWGGRPHAFAPDLLKGDLKIIHKLVEQYEIPVEIYTPEHNAYPYNYMIGSESQWEDSMNYLTDALHCGKALGAEYTLVSVGHSGGIPVDERRKRLRMSLVHLSREAEQIGHKIVVEPLTPLESDFCNTSTELLEILTEVNSPFVQGMCDVVVPFVQRLNPAEEIRLLGEHMMHLHLVDSDGITDTHLLPGEGIMNLRGFLSELKDTGYDGRATIELVTNYIDRPSEAAFSAIQSIIRMI